MLFPFVEVVHWSAVLLEILFLTTSLTISHINIRLLNQVIIFLYCQFFSVWFNYITLLNISLEGDLTSEGDPEFHFMAQVYGTKELANHTMDHVLTRIAYH